VFLPFALDRPGRDNLVWLVMPDGAQFQCEKFSGMLGCELSLLHHKRETLALVRGLARIAEGVAV
jgi:hypothetical protein